LLEAAPSRAYYEDWRVVEGSGAGPVVALDLESEVEVATGQDTGARGALLVCGSHAVLVRDARDEGLLSDARASGKALRQVLQELRASTFEHGLSSPSPPPGSPSGQHGGGGDFDDLAHALLSAEYSYLARTLLPPPPPPAAAASVGRGGNSGGSNGSLLGSSGGSGGGGGGGALFTNLMSTLPFLEGDTMEILGGKDWKLHRADGVAQQRAIDRSPSLWGDGTASPRQVLRTWSIQAWDDH
jgi:hypothetical protein